jgi:signal transduction histidine kinase/CheY-like chemotaxis protein
LLKRGANGETEPSGEPDRAEVDVMPHFSAVVLISVAGWLTFPLAYGSRGYWRITSVDGLAAMGELLVYWAALHLTRRRARVLASHVCLAVALVGIVACARLSGDGVSLSAWYLVALPLGSAYISGWRGALGWTAATALATLYLGAAGQWFPIEREVVLRDWEWTVGQLVMIGVVAGFAISSRRLVEKQLETIRERERLLEERAEELARARDAAVRASEARSRFLANMSHEIRTPLNGVLGMADLLEGTPLSESQRELLSTIRSSGILLLSVVNDILDFSRLEAGGIELEKTVVDLQVCLDDLLDLFGPQAAGRGVDLAGWLEPAVPARVLGDPTRIRQLLANLIGNAVKFTSAGSIQVRVGRQDAHLRVSVRDTGIGIAPEVQAQLFRPFIQADASTTRRFGGSGLGLAICKRLAEAMEGTIRVHSEEGRGSTFEVTLRADDADGQPRPPLAHAGRHVIFVEPDDGSRHALEAMAQTLGLHSAVLPDLDALDLAVPLLERAEAFVVALPERDALAAVTRVYQRWPSIPVGRLRSVVEREGAADARFQAVAHKPLTMRRLVHLLDALCTSRVQLPTLPETAADLARRRPLRILVAEDNPVNQQVVLLMLRQLGYEPDLASNGQEAVAACAGALYDLVFMDMHMPVMDGLEATRLIRASSAPAPRIVALTASVLPAERQKFREAGVDGFLAKPLELEALIGVIEQQPFAPAGLAPPRSTEVLDPVPLTRLRELCAEDPARFSHLVETYLKGARDTIVEMRDAITGRDPVRLQMAAHSLRTSAATFGAMRVSALAAELEQGSGSDWSHDAAALDEIEAGHRYYLERLAQG